MFTKTVFPAALVAIAAYFYLNGNGPTTDSDEAEIEENIISAWQNVIQSPEKKFQRVAVGINANMDLIVPAVELLKALGVQPGGKADHDNLDTLDKLQETFSVFFAKGSAAERYFGNAELFKKIIETASTLKQKMEFIGGNAALMANRITSLFPDTQIQFVGPVGPGMRALFPKSIQIPIKSQVDTDEVHLIMEYKVGDQWGPHVSPVATRFITSYDKSNSEVTMMETFFDSLVSYQPDLIMISGLHMMEGMKMTMFKQRLDAFVERLDTVAPSIPIHLELASMAKADYLRIILNKVLPRITSLGLNEQEIAFSSYVGNGPHPGLFFDSSGQPEIHLVSDMIEWIFKTFGHSKHRQSSRLTRVHFHSLTYHIIAVIPSEWENSLAAVAAGTRLAGRQACDVDVLSEQKVELKIPKKFKLFSDDQERVFNSETPVNSWTKAGIQFYFSPVLVCTDPEKTVGLGDAISSTGLLYSYYKHSPKKTNIS